MSYLLYEYLIENKKINIKWIIIMTLMLMFIVVFAFVRIGSKFNLNLIKEVPVLLLNELGFSAVPTIIIIRNIPFLKNFEYGKSFLDSIARVLRLDKIFSTVSEYGSELVVKIENMDWGLGFSLVAEGYLNFGSYISLFVLIIGIFYGYFLIIKNNASLLKKIYHCY